MQVMRELKLREYLKKINAEKRNLTTAELKQAQIYFERQGHGLNAIQAALNNHQKEVFLNKENSELSEADKIAAAMGLPNV